ncbi:nucleoside recognition domain-containing protein [Candidatus Spyradosoma sp. SGI.093]|uniref:nucleoside recognition domain-containing protein n=1 Tax=Candidatus Spyradosoma sp. SGI.093 TaxID=3420583 RepID=UPI003D0564E1
MRATDWQSAAENLAARVAFGNAADALLEAAERGGNAPVACACSGGADSLCALLLLWAKFPRLRERLLVLHYDHAAREDSAADAEFVRRVAAALGVPAREIEAALADVEVSLEESAVAALAEELEAHVEGLKSLFVKDRAAALEVAPEFVSAALAKDNLAAGLDNAVSEAYLENSYLGRFGKFCQPVFAPAGFDWRITVGVLGSFPARELIVSTLGITYSLGGDVDEENEGLYDAMEKTTHADGSPVFTIPVIVGIMVFFALCGQCLAEIVVIARESSWRWAIVAWAQMTFLAWLGAVLCYQIGSLL